MSTKHQVKRPAQRSSKPAFLRITTRELKLRIGIAEELLCQNLIRSARMAGNVAERLAVYKRELAFRDQRDGVTKGEPQGQVNFKAIQVAFQAARGHSAAPLRQAA